MTPRSRRLFDEADQQISELIGLLSKGGPSAVERSCRGREKLGDGSVGACVAHIADRYGSIADFLGVASAVAPGSGHPMPHSVHGHHQSNHGAYVAVTVDVDGLVHRLGEARRLLAVLAELSDAQLDTVPAPGVFRFCDGTRSVEAVVLALLKHQGHQVEAVRAAVG